MVNDNEVRNALLELAKAERSDTIGAEERATKAVVKALAKAVLELMEKVEALEQRGR